MNNNKSFKVNIDYVQGCIATISIRIERNSPKDITPTAWMAFHLAKTHASSVGTLDKTFSHEEEQKHTHCVYI